MTAKADSSIAAADTAANMAAGDSAATWQILAGLRFGLAAIVVSYHLTWFVPQGAAVTFLARFGPLAAVMGFLFISGYSIAHSIARRPKGFYRRRVIRIYPLYAAAILFSLLPFAMMRHAIHIPGHVLEPPHAEQIAANLAMLETVIASPIASNPVIWTLVVEVMCYLLAPLLSRLNTQNLLLCAAPSLIAFCLFPDLDQKYHLGYYGVENFGLPLLFLAWPWLAGFIFCRHRKSIPAAAIFVVASVVLVYCNQSYGARFSELTIGVSAALLAVAPRLKVPPALGKPLIYLGDLSYPLYLFHFPAIVLAWSLFYHSGPWTLAIFAIIVSALALGFESAIREKLFRHRAHVPAGQQSIIEPTAA